MAAGLGFKTFTTGEVLTAADVNGYLMQGILVFANAAARTSAITSPQEGQYSFLKDTNALEYYDGAAWVGAPVGDITAVTAGTGISGGGSSGAVTITNDMATTITASGDIVVGTGNGTYDNLPIGSTGQVLTADTTVSPYKVKWATASSGGMTSLASGSMSGTAAIDLTSISGAYNTLIVFMYGVNTNGNGQLLRLNADTGSNYQGFLTRFYNNAVNSGAYSSSFIHCAGDTTPDNDASGIVQIEIPMYAQTSGKKIVNVLSYFVTNGGIKTTANASYAYTGTTAAITQVNILTGGGNWTAGNYVLYGVK